MRNILVCVGGESPAVITSTLYALANPSNSDRARIKIDEMHVVTTNVGFREINERLGVGGPGPLREVVELCTHGEQVADPEFHGIGPSGAYRDDIVDEEDLIHLANTVARLILKLTADDDVRIIASIVGGRSSMSFWVGQAMSLFARPQDRLCHVLVNTPFEQCPDFFFPPAVRFQARVVGLVPRMEKRKEYPPGERIWTDKARLTVSDIPFVRNRPLLVGSRLLPDKKKARKTDCDPSTFDIRPLVEEVNLANGDLTLAFEPAGCRIHLGNVRSLDLPIDEFSLYLWCAKVAHQRREIAAKEASAGAPDVEDASPPAPVTMRELRESPFHMLSLLIDIVSDVKRVNKPNAERASGDTLKNLATKYQDWLQNGGSRSETPAQELQDGIAQIRSRLRAKLRNELWDPRLIEILGLRGGDRKAFAIGIADGLARATFQFL